MSDKDKVVTYEIKSVDLHSGYANVLFSNPWNTGENDVENVNEEKMISVLKNGNIMADEELMQVLDAEAKALFNQFKTSYDASKMRAQMKDRTNRISKIVGLKGSYSPNANGKK